MSVLKLKPLSCIISLLLCDLWHISWNFRSGSTLCLINILRMNYWFCIFVCLCFVIFLNQLLLFFNFKAAEIYIFLNSLFKCLYAVQFFIRFYQHWLQYAQIIKILIFIFSYFKINILHYYDLSKFFKR